MMKRGLLLLLVVLSACSARKADDGADAKPVALVTTAQAARGDIAQTVTAYGAVEIAPGAERSLVAPVEAIVASVQAGPGSPVEAGQTVATLAPSPAARLEVEKAAQDARTAEAAFARAVRLRATGLDSDADVEAARAAARVAAATRASLEARSAAVVLKAPAAGVVDSVALAPGDLAAAGAVVAKVASLRDLRVRLGVEPGTAARLRRGAAVHLRPLDGGLARGVEARVDAVDPRADPQTRLASVIAVAPAGGGLIPGQPLAGEIVVAERTGVLLIPRAALLYDQDKPYVFVAAAGAAHRRPVTLGAGDDAQVEIVQGLAPGERVVVDGAAALDDGMAVREAAAGKGGS